MTFSALKKKDVICMADGRLLGRVSDLELDGATGQILALIVPAGGSCLSGLLHGEKNQAVIPWNQIACIGDDVILVSASCCGC